MGKGNSGAAQGTRDTIQYVIGDSKNKKVIDNLGISIFTKIVITACGPQFGTRRGPSVNLF